MTIQPQKFLFETEFGVQPRRDDLREAQIEAERLASLAEAREQGRMEGFMQGEQAALNSIEQQRLQAVQRLSEALDGHMSELAGVEERLRAEALSLSLAIATKLAETLIIQHPLEQLKTLVDDCFANLRQVPHLVIRVHDSLLDMSREAVEAVARERGFEGRLVFLAEPTILPGDCRIEWANGGLVLDRTETQARIADTIARALGSVPDPLPPVSRTDHEAQS
jgi:flagellar assembly protein FliH